MPRRPPLAALLAAALAAGPAAAELADDDRAAIRAEMRAYLLENPEILTEMLAILEERQRAASTELDGERVAAQAAALFDDGFSHVAGNPAGDVTVVEFLDYQCGYCKRAHPEVSALLAADPGVRLVVKELPILGPASELAARAAIATLMTEGPEAYARISDRLMRLEGPVTDASLDAALDAAGLETDAVRRRMTDPEVTRRIEATRALAAALDVQGTPSFVFGDRILRGYAPLDAMRALVDEVRAGG
jgi:protein-disulfide isomerase